MNNMISDFQFDVRRLTGIEIKILDYLIQLTVISRKSPKSLTYRFQFQFKGKKKEMPQKKRCRRWKGDIENVENIALQDISDSSLERQSLFLLQNTSACCFCSCSKLQVGRSDLFNSSLPPKKRKEKKKEAKRKEEEIKIHSLMQYCLLPTQF